MKFKASLIFAAAALLTTSAAYAAQPCDLIFTQKAGGKYIYCNNRESISPSDLADTGNENAKFLMNNDGLTPDNYAMFLSFGNRTDLNADGTPTGSRGFDIEVDALFRAREDTTITITALGFEVPEQKNVFLGGTQYAVEDEWGCYTCWAQYLKHPIRQINSGNTYSPSEFHDITVTLKAGDEAWLSEYIEGYRSVPLARSVNIMTNFTIESGVCDVNIAALRSLGSTGDRSNFDRDAAYGTYYRDRQYKGISDGLNEVTAELSYTIDDSEPSGAKLPVTVYNSFKPEGNTITDWYTHLNPKADEWSYELCAESDMIGFTYHDPYKKYLYGNKVPDDQKDEYYHFDIDHTDWDSYKQEYGSYSDYVPNREIRSGDRTTDACNLANYGVIYNYNIKITNNGNQKRYLIYRLATGSDNIVYAKDSEGNVIGGNILSKGLSYTRIADDMTSLPVPAQSTVSYTVCVILPPNNPGGMENSLVISDFASLIQTYEPSFSGISKDRYFDGREYYSWADGKLSLSNDRINWREIRLPDEVTKDIYGRMSSFELLWTGNGYIIRPMLYDAGWYLHVNYMFKDMYLLDEDFNLISKHTFGGYPQAASVANGVYYLKLAGSVYRSTTEFKWWDLTDMEMPCWNYGRLSAMNDNGKIKFSENGVDFYETEFKDFRPDYIDAYGEYYYCCDGRVLYLSKDGLNWKYVMFGNRVKSFEISGGNVIANSTEERAMPEFPDTFAIRLNGRFISGITEPLLINNSPYIPLRSAAELLGYSISWNDGNVTLEKDGVVTKISDALIINDTAYAPLKVLPLELGINTTYDGITAVADITAS